MRIVRLRQEGHQAEAADAAVAAERQHLRETAHAGLAAMADDVRVLAAKEGLTAHATSVDMRLPKGDKP